MPYERPTFEFWDLEEEIVTESLNTAPESGEGDDDSGDFEWDW